MPKGIKGFQKGHHHSENTRKQMGESHKKNPTRYWLGKKRDNPEYIEKIKKAHFGQKAWNKDKKMPEMSGKNHPNWQGGKSFEEYGIEWTDDLKESIRKRDNYICQMEGCGIHQDELDEKLHIHHIDYDKKNLNPKNLITLCRNCHIKTNFNRNYWKNYFTKS